MITSNFARILLLAAFGLGLAFSASVVRGEESTCTVKIPNDRFMGFLSQMRSNLAFRDGEVVGFRIYEKSNPGVLAELGLRSDDLMTHFCGVKIHDALSAEEAICCTAQEPMRNGVELTVEREGKVIRVTAPMPNKRVQATRSKQRAPDA
jgi:hypothetical protein